VSQILIVEDDSVSALICSRLLEHAGHSVTVAADGLAAIERLETSEIHAVVTDLLMPRMDGHELCDRIRGDARWTELPIIVVTGVAEPEALAWIDDYPNVQLLEKPIKVANLIEALDARLSTDRLA
jgi:CheY-like chemotaxis protein